MDGMASELVATWALGSMAEYIKADYSKPLPAFEERSHIFFIDYAPPLDVLTKLADDGCLIVILDHHLTNVERYHDFQHSNVDVHFDLTRSGAMLAFEYFFPDWKREGHVPVLLQYVQDYDLWRFELPSSREVNAALASYSQDIETYGILAGTAKQDLKQLITEGRALLRQQTQNVQAQLEQVRGAIIGDWYVPAVNGSLFLTNAVGEALRERYPEAPFVAIYYDLADGARKWSLRSSEGSDVQHIAQRYNGGGHPQSAAFIIPAFTQGPRFTVGPYTT